MPNYLDDFVCERTIEEMEQEYISRDTWREVEYSFCEQMGIEVECYDD